MKYLFPVSVPVLALFSFASLGCTGIFDGQTHNDRQGANPSGNPPTPGAGGTGSTTSNTPTVAKPAEVPFKVRNTEPELVPFEMRLRRIANTLGVAIDHPMFADMNKNSLKLGDYDYANGALPDGSWNANRIAAWLLALKPVCNSPEMKAKYPTLPGSLPGLIRAAWGHVPSADDTADFQNAIAATGADADVNYESTCMAVFTAAEFVYR
jgi:hypothetical protein